MNYVSNKLITTLCNQHLKPFALEQLICMWLNGITIVSFLELYSKIRKVGLSLIPLKAFRQCKYNLENFVTLSIFLSFFFFFCCGSEFVRFSVNYMPLGFITYFCMYV